MLAAVSEKTQNAAMTFDEDFDRMATLVREAA